MNSRWPALGRDEGKEIGLGQPLGHDDRDIGPANIAREPGRPKIPSIFWPVPAVPGKHAHDAMLHCPVSPVRRISLVGDGGVVEPSVPDSSDSKIKVYRHPSHRRCLPPWRSGRAATHVPAAGRAENERGSGDEDDGGEAADDGRPAHPVHWSGSARGSTWAVGWCYVIPCVRLRVWFPRKRNRPFMPRARPEQSVVRSVYCLGREKDFLRPGTCFGSRAGRPGSDAYHLGNCKMRRREQQLREWNSLESPYTESLLAAGYPAPSLCWHLGVDVVNSRWRRTGPMSAASMFAFGSP